MRSSIILLSALSALATCAALPPTKLKASHEVVNVIRAAQADFRPGRPSRPVFPGRPGRPTSAVVVPSSTIPSATEVASDIASVTSAVAVETSTAAASATPIASNCLANVALPAEAAALPAPADGTNLVLIAYGVGTQNYTCANETATPVAFGALATLHNTSCTAEGSIQADEQGPTVGEHFFVDNTTPDFNVDGLGNTQLSKTASIAAPDNTNGDVPWLLLTAKESGSTSAVKNIYRLVTGGGSAPATCAGQSGVVTVPYTAQYWFYAA